MILAESARENHAIYGFYGLSVFAEVGGLTWEEIASTKHRLDHASPRAALRYQHATAKRDEAIADGIDRILDAAQDEAGGDVLRFRGSVGDT